MLHRIREAKKNESGFTLIELLIVIVILGILAAIVVFSISGINDRGTLSACKSDKKSVEVAGEAFYAQNGNYAANVGALVPTFLHEVPSATNGYVITYATVAGPPPSFTVTSNLAGC
jgi:prepilin-type N-terminal cleavage/methylation domain-containing protein